MATETPPQRPEPKLVTKLRAQRDQHRERSRVVRVLFVLVGFTLLLAGIAMLVAPGPAFVVIPIGLAILSLEFRWAENMLEKSLEQADKAAQKASETTRAQRMLAGVATALGVAAVAAWAVFGDIPVLPV
jgi:uncharacterized protein (TIGR02611 family)